MSKKSARHKHSPLAPALPVHPSDLLCQTGLQWHQQGQLGKAQVFYEMALKEAPRHFDALHFSGILSYQLQLFKQAIAQLKEAIAVQPTQAEPYSNLGLCLLAEGQFEAAIQAYDRALELNPNFPQAHFNRGNVFQALGKHKEACADFHHALTLHPKYIEAFYNRGVSLHALNRLEEALSSYEQAISMAPQFAAAHSNRAYVLMDLGQPTQALAGCEQALTIAPDYAQAHANRGHALLSLDRPAEAKQSLLRAIEIQPDLTQAHFNLGNACHALGELDQAIACYDQAIRIEPQFAWAHWNKSLVLLLQGDYLQGWPLYEWRWKKQDTAHLKRDFEQPLWLGQSSLLGQTILLHAEQGLGDTIQFVRFAAAIQALGAKVVLEVHPALVEILRSLSGVDAVIAQGQSLPHFDLHCPLLSLPLALKTTLNDLPSITPYLHADESKITYWRNKLGIRTKPRIGVVWSSTSGFKDDRRRSMPLSRFIQCLDTDRFEVVCLQKELKEEDQVLMSSHRFPIRFFGGGLGDFSDTAALAMCMDLVVSTCTSVPHLCGALGIPTWVLLAQIPDWRWLMDRHDSPWYPSIRLYRQNSSDAWGSVLTRVRQDLAALDWV